MRLTRVYFLLTFIFLFSLKIFAQPRVSIVLDEFPATVFSDNTYTFKIRIKNTGNAIFGPSKLQLNYTTNWEPASKYSHASFATVGDLNPGDSVSSTISNFKVLGLLFSLEKILWLYGQQVRAV